MARSKLSLVVLCGSLAAVCGAAGGYFAAPRATAEAREPAPVPAPQDGELRAELARLAERQDSLEAALAEERGDFELVAPSSARIAPDEIEAAVARWMAERHSAGGDLGAPAAAEPEPSTEERVAEALARLDAGELSDVEWQALWREFGEQGLTDELVAAFEARAAAAPNDPDAQVALAGAYLGKILEVGNSPEAGEWAVKADRAYDRALEIDDHHWEARFSKAMSLSFWPPVFGKQGEAIRQFEILAEQQEDLPRDERYAQTYLLLGNMHRQIGDPEQALAAWQRGIELYPGHAELEAQLELHSKAP
jgi:tetratricopeptide (TPR) repeat protein